MSDRLTRYNSIASGLPLEPREPARNARGKHKLSRLEKYRER